MKKNKIIKKKVKIKIWKLFTKKILLQKQTIVISPDHTFINVLLLFLFYASLRAAFNVLFHFCFFFVQRFNLWPCFATGSVVFFFFSSSVCCCCCCISCFTLFFSLSVFGFSCIFCFFYSFFFYTFVKLYFYFFSGSGGGLVFFESTLYSIHNF